MLVGFAKSRQCLYSTLIIYGFQNMQNLILNDMLLLKDDNLHWHYVKWKRFCPLLAHFILYHVVYYMTLRHRCNIQSSFQIFIMYRIYLYPKIPCIRYNFDFVYFTGTNRNSLSKKSFSQLPVTDIECRLDRRFLLIRMFAFVNRDRFDSKIGFAAHTEIIFSQLVQLYLYKFQNIKQKN